MFDLKLVRAEGSAEGFVGAQRARHRGRRHRGNHRDGPFMSRFSRLEDHLELRRGLRPCRCGLGGRRGRHHGDQHAGRDRGVARPRRSGFCCARCASSRRPNVTFAPGGGAEGLCPEQGERCATARSGWSGWVASGRRSRAGSTPCRCRWSDHIGAGRRRASPTGAIRQAHRHGARGRRAAGDHAGRGRRPRNLIDARACSRRSAGEGIVHQHGARVGGGRGRR